jgi:molybdate transport system substrate-binding protein
MRMISLVVPMLCLLVAACSTGAATSTPERPAPASPPPAQATATRTAAGQPTRNAQEIVVFAASSLTDVFRDLGRTFEARNPGTRVTFQFAGTPALRNQLEGGARADVFASANQQQLDQASASGVVVDSGRTFAANRLVVITPAQAPVVKTLQDLANPGVKLVIAQADVPVGSYTAQSIIAMDTSGLFPAGFSRRLNQNIVSEESNVRAVVAKVALGEADAAFVYATDVTKDVGPKLQVIAIPAQFNVEAVYPIARVTESANPQGAAAFIGFVLSEDGQAVLARHGFESP